MQLSKNLAAFQALFDCHEYLIHFKFECIQ